MVSLLGILVLNALQLRTLFGLFNFFGFERHWWVFCRRNTRLAYILNLVLVSMMSLFTCLKNLPIYSNYERMWQHDIQYDLPNRKLQIVLYTNWVQFERSMLYLLVFGFELAKVSLRSVPCHGLFFYISFRESTERMSQSMLYYITIHISTFCICLF